MKLVARGSVVLEAAAVSWDHVPPAQPFTCFTLKKSKEWETYFYHLAGDDGTPTIVLGTEKHTQYVQRADKSLFNFICDLMSTSDNTFAPEI